jgi:RNA polymerase sigma-32 factor
VSLDQPAYSDGDETMIDMVGSDDNIEEMVEEREKQRIVEQKVGQFKKILNERELYIFEHRIMTDEPLTLQEIGNHFKISRERARQIEKVLSNKVAKHLIEGKPATVQSKTQHP